MGELVGALLGPAVVDALVGSPVRAAEGDAVGALGGAADGLPSGPIVFGRRVSR